MLTLSITKAPAFTPGHRLIKPPLGKAHTSLQLATNDITDGLKNVFLEVNNGLRDVAGNLDKVNIGMNVKSKEILQTLLSRIQTVLDGESALQLEFTKYFTNFVHEIDQWLLIQNPEIEMLFKQTLNQLSLVTFNTPAVIGITTILTYMVVTSILTWGEAPPPSKPYPLQRYDPVAAQAYFDGRTSEFVGRALAIAVKSLGFGLSILQDQIRYVI